MSENRGIPTLYAGTRFRSRLEARWAAFFDLAGWRWEYEPIDLDGWIPDFLLLGPCNGTLVEIKPISQFDQGVADKCDKATEKQREVLLLGATIDPTPMDRMDALCGPKFGWLGETYNLRNDEKPNGSDEIWWQDCHFMALLNGRWDFYPAYGQYSGRITGTRWKETFGYEESQRDLVRLWREAGNRVQWRSPIAKAHETYRPL